MVGVERLKIRVLFYVFIGFIIQLMPHVLPYVLSKFADTHRSRSNLSLLD